MHVSSSGEASAVSAATSGSSKGGSEVEPTRLKKVAATRAMTIPLPTRSA
eukprot:CAMPEP_0175895866 /NCGR_PEP_ID=MMETSP0107_2-20121207/50736_1 /TAXON_ID=195067 ORGANISM="Goniomonas pacifica, Strain CCMP1869" /NCGR_SAMPLE_ID=MMETSP0107_2 /ASSEMBLY_ACC=CAM_ASM_000203 /LENGTH=49 /DNA_ID= /DNA_START= /DNA_END= /DNA_ORIENTATION=